jgi:cytoskeletal protein RodZ
VKEGFDVSIGETLARARREAGLSVADISNRTRIRQSIIERIERDHYSARGIDFFTRGEIREIAQVVGVDSKELIDAYDATRLPAVPRPRAAEQPHRPPARPTQPAAGPALAAKVSEAVRSVMAELRQVNKWIWRLGLALLAVGAVGGILLIRGTSGQAVRQTSAGARHQPTHAEAHKADSQHRTPAHAARSPGSTPSPRPRSSQSVQVLVPTAIAAFGPGGTSQGDSPGLAHMAVAGQPATPWHSAWYTTPHFGNLESGTGLLLDMGRIVTVTGARIALGNGPGADLNLRVGNAPVLGDLAPVARASGVGHVVQLRPQPTRGRYVLVWFTRLPPDQTGTFQVSVYDIKVIGYR